MPIVSRNISVLAVMNGLTRLSTAGIGENSSYMRKLVCTDMDYFGIHLDEAKVRSKELREIPLNLRLKFWSFRQMKS
jgi:acetate kinase